MSDKKDLLLRIGNVQLITFWEGEGIQRHLVARIGKVVDEEEVLKNPSAVHDFTMEDLAAVEVLCKEAVSQALNKQSIDFNKVKKVDQ